MFGLGTRSRPTLEISLQSFMAERPDHRSSVACCASRNKPHNALGMSAARSAASSERSERLAPTGYVSRLPPKPRNLPIKQPIPNDRRPKSTISPMPPFMYLSSPVLIRGGITYQTTNAVEPAKYLRPKSAIEFDFRHGEIMNHTRIAAAVAMSMLIATYISIASAITMPP
jgi:hypothetical protein